MSEQNSTKSSSIKLTTIAVIKKPASGSAEPQIVYGGARTIKREDGKFDIEVGSVPLLSRQKAPEPASGLLMLYGYRDTIGEIQARRAECRQIGGEFKFAEIEYDVGYIEPQQIDRAKLKGLRFANVMRMAQDLQQDILNFFSTAIEKEGSANEKLTRIKQISQRPDLFSDMIAADPDFADIELLIIPVMGSATSADVVRQVALVLPKAKPKSIEQNATGNDTRLILPENYDVLLPA